MTVIEKITEINDVIKDIFEYTQKNEDISTDFNEYIATLGAKQIPLNQVEKIFLPYIFERKLGEKSTSILELFLEDNQNHKKIIQSLLNAQNSIFEIKRILKNGFELYNLVNEKTYTVLSLTKMTSFRGIYSGQYIVARIFEYDNEYYIIEISSVLSHSQKNEAMRYAIMKLIQEPTLLYADNKEKEKEIKAAIDDMHDKFIKCFKQDIILTTNKYADEIIGAFNDGEEIDLSDKQPELEEYKFFHVKELDNNYSNFLENSMGGFSGHAETYDVAIIFDKENGLYTVPFYNTFSKILDGEEIENKKDCIEYFLQNDSISASILKRIASEHKNFLDVINETLETEYTFDELIQKYKSDFVKKKIYSSATVLYCSKVFSQMFDIISTPKPQTEANNTAKVGRNDPCPCGSGKKYKNCCGKV